MGASPHSGHAHMRRIHNLARFIGEIYIAKMISLARLMSRFYQSTIYTQILNENYHLPSLSTKSKQICYINII